MSKIIMLFFMLMVAGCGSASPVDLHATVEASIQNTLEAQKNIEATIEYAIESTLQARETQQYKEALPSTVVPNVSEETILNSDAPIGILNLALCEEYPRFDTCYNIPSVQDDVFFITIWIRDFNGKEIPFVKIGNTHLNCKVASFSHDVQSISCFTSSLPIGEEEIQILSPQGQLLAAGKIKNYIPIPSTPSYP